MSSKISEFCAQLMTVRGLMTVDRSPAMKALRVRSATRTMLAMVLRPFSVWKRLDLRKHDRLLLRVRQVVQGGDDRPAVHLGLVDLLGAVIEAGRVAEADRVGGGEQAERRVRADDAVLVEEGEAAGGFEHALDDEHHVRPAGIVLVENQRHIVLIAPGKNSLAELGDLLAVLQHDRILADEIDAADVAVEIDADARPVQAGGDLLDMGRLAGAMIAGDHDAPVVGKAGEDRERGLAIEDVVLVEVGDLVGGL